jgi:hypothetical protein
VKAQHGAVRLQAFRLLCLLRLFPAGAVAEEDLHLLEKRFVTAHVRTGHPCSLPKPITRPYAIVLVSATVRARQKRDRDKLPDARLGEPGDPKTVAPRT